MIVDGMDPVAAVDQACAEVIDENDRRRRRLLEGGDR
jgi:hypothetical protein